MRFRWNDKEFDGPRVDKGPLAGFTMGELQWAKQQLKLQRIEQLDAVESTVLYYLLSIRRTNHELLPISQWGDLSIADFDVCEHPADLDVDGDCRECGNPARAPWHVGEPVPTSPASGTTTS